MLKKVIISLIIGIFITIFFAQHDPWTHQKIISYIQKNAREFLGADFSGLVHSIHFFSPSLIVHDIQMKSALDNTVDSDQWIWRCKKCEVTCSWLQLLFKGVLEQHIIMDGFECRSLVENNRIAIESHLIALMNQPVPFIPTHIKSVIFKNSFLHFEDIHKEIQTSLWFNSSSLRIGQRLKTTISIGDAHILYQKNKYIENATIDISMLTGFMGDDFDVNAHIAGTCMLSHMQADSSCYITGVWNGLRGRFSIRNAYNSLIIDPIIVNEREMRINGHFPLSYAIQCMRNSFADQSVSGTGDFVIKMNRDISRKIDGQLVIENAMFNERNLCDVIKVIFERNHDDWKTRLSLSRNNQECKGTGHWSEANNKGELSIKNNTDLYTTFFPYWRIKHNSFAIHSHLTQSVMQGSYEVLTTNILNGAQHAVKGSFSYDHGECVMEGRIDEDEFYIQTACVPHYALRKCLYTDREKRELIALRAIEDNKIRGSIAFPFIRAMINNVFHYDMQGEGSIDIIAHIAMPEIAGDITLTEASIRLPQTYNFIDGLRAHYVCNIINKLVLFEDVNISLHMGKIRCLRADYYFDHKGSLLFMHAPVLLDRCLLNVKKDLFAVVSGNLLFSRSALLPACVSGNIFIDKAQLKENLFSDVIQKQLVSYTHSVFSLPDVPLWCDLTLETKSPICVDTGFFQTNAHARLRIKKEDHDPIVKGAIILHSGTLNFPYKPLHINKGIITFTDKQLFDPAIEFIARNKIKKYDVALQVEGSLIAHHISLDANPPLSEEQIVGLLLVGSEEHSLNSMMPALIVQNVKNLIFSNNQVSFFDKYFKPILGTLNINLVPSFTDQTGRGGLRGALEITVEDRWRAIIQKNFSLTEDTKFELEYLFSDDITLRAIRDERRDLGGEIEMRWKF